MSKDAVSRYIHPSLDYVQYDDYGGIIRYGTLAIGFVEDMVTQGGNWLTGVSNVNMDMRVNLQTKELEPKTPCEAVVNGTTLTNLPIPCSVFIAFQKIDVDDGELELEFEQPGNYPIVVRSRTHLDGMYMVVA